MENHKSHGSLPVRIGAVVFGLGALVYFAFEFVASVEHSAAHSPCFYPARMLNKVFAFLLILLQTALIFLFPRLNLKIYPLVDRYASETLSENYETGFGSIVLGYVDVALCQDTRRTYSSNVCTLTFSFFSSNKISSYYA